MTLQECHSTCRLSYFSFVLLGIKPRTLNLVGKCSATELCPQHFHFTLKQALAMYSRLAWNLLGSSNLQFSCFSLLSSRTTCVHYP